MTQFRKEVRDAERYVPPIAGRLGKLRLDFGENTVGPSPKVMRALRGLTAEEVSAYPESRWLAEKISAYCRVEPENVLLFNGSDEAIDKIFDAVRGPGKKGGGEVVMPSPTYSPFELYAKLAGLEVREVLLEDDERFSFPLARVLAAIDRKTSVVIVCSPNNPTGTTVTRKQAERILRKARRVGAWVLADEAYIEFGGQTLVPLLRKYDNLLVLRTLSKAFGLAGLRMGYALGQPQVIERLAAAARPYPISGAGLRAGIAAFGDLAYMRAYVREVGRSRAWLRKALAKLGVDARFGEANAFILKLGPQVKFVVQKLRERGILVRDRSGYPLLAGCCRVTIGTRQQMKRFVRELKAVLAEPVLVFDVDGVLVDVSRSYRAAIQRTVEELTGKKVSPAEIQALKNEGGYNNDWDASRELARRKGLRPKVPRARVVEVFQEKYLGKNFDGLCVRERWLLDKGLLERLAKNYRLAVLTGRPRAEAEFVLERFGVRGSFAEIVCMEDVPAGKGKPNPWGLREVLRRLGAERAGGANAYFGDTVDDQRAAKAAGLTAIGVLPCGQDQGRALARVLRKAGAGKVFGTNDEAVEEWT